MRKRKSRRDAHRHDPSRRREKAAVAAGGLQRITAAWFAAGDAAPAATWRYLPHMLIAAFIARAAVALSGDFLLHPDEIMQYLEPAHYAAFGNGVLYWEYVHGARAWLIPGFVTGILLTLDALGLGRPGVYVAAVKLGFCLISLLLPWAMYRFTQRAAGEHAARLALLFGCFWYELVVMAHKPFTEFVGSAFLMAALALLVGADAGRRRTLLAAGALLALSAAVRMQYAPVVILLLALRSPTLHRAQLASLWGGAALLAALVGALEWQTWGAPFHSYMTNFLVNINIGVGRAGESSRWQLPGQLLAAGGGAPALAFFFGAKLRGAARLLLLLSAVTFLLHMFPEHREYRFIFLLIPCWLMLLAALLARAEIMPAVRRYGAAALLAFGVFALAGVFPWQSWIHIGYSNEKPVHYLRHQDPMFAVMKHLAAQEDLRGVFYFAEQAPYFRTGGYYYLHRSVPFYTAHTWSEAGKHRPGAPPGEFVSHIVTEDRMRAEDLGAFSETFRAGNLVVWRRDADAPVARWRAHVVRQSAQDMNLLIGNTVRRLRGTPLGLFLAKHYWPQAPASVEFAEDAAQ
ncbi:MAG: hypothetical protein OD817_04070 [Gammaproteobacteria bacterium]